MTLGRSVETLMAVVSIAGLVAACGQRPEESPGAESPAGQEAKAAGEPGAPEVPWEQKNRQQRMEYMGLYVFPKMKEIFQAADPEGYADFKCQTCHGDDMEDVDFEMPNSLYALPADNPFEAAKEYDEQTTMFMAEKVLPAMAELLGREPGKELRCLSCHQTEE